MFKPNETLKTEPYDRFSFVPQKYAKQIKACNLNPSAESGRAASAEEDEARTGGAGEAAQQQRPDQQPAFLTLTSPPLPQPLLSPPSCPSLTLTFSFPLSLSSPLPHQLYNTLIWDLPLALSSFLAYFPPRGQTPTLRHCGCVGFVFPLYIYIYIYIYTHTHVYIIHIYIYIHTYIHYIYIYIYTCIGIALYYYDYITYRHNRISGRL